MATITVLGVPHAYELTAPTRAPHVLVFIHGWLLSRSYWQPLIEKLSPQFQCLSYDLRGFGESKLLPSALEGDFKHQGRPQPAPLKLAGEPTPVSKPQGQSEITNPSPLLPEQGLSKYTAAAYARDLQVLLQQLNITSTWLIGHSLGGSIGLWGADRLGQTVKGVVCINAGGGIYLKEEFERFRAVGQRLLKFRPHWMAYLPLVDWMFSRAQVARPVARCWGRQRLVDYLAAHPEAALGALLDPTTEAEVHLLPQVVARLRQPVYFIAGKEDTIMEPKYVHYLASFHAANQSKTQSNQSRVIEIPCGHMAMIEQPEAIAAQLRLLLQAA